MSSLLGVGGLGGDAGGSAGDGALSLEDVLTLLADCEDSGAGAVHFGDRQSSSSPSGGFHDVDFAALHFGWPPTPPGSDGDLPMHDPLEHFEDAHADLVAVEESGVSVVHDATRSPNAVEPMSDHDVETSPSPVSTPPVSSARGETSAGVPAAAAKKKKKKAGYNSNKARDQRKEELLYLRKKVDQMETYLRKLRETSARNNSISSSSSTGRGARVFRNALVGQLPTASAVRRAVEARDASALRLAEVGPVWEDIAARQYKERRRAEMENIRLKLVLESQLKMAKSLEKVLNKRYNERVRASARSFVRDGSSLMPLVVFLARSWSRSAGSKS